MASNLTGSAARLTLTQESLLEGARWLANRDPNLAAVLQTYGPPPLWDRPPGFATLVYIILEQQVSLASARAAYQRLGAAIAPISPENFLTLGDAPLKAIGFSRQKTVYARELAQAVLSGALDFASLSVMEDAAVRAALVRLKGIGRWSADIYLLMALLRADIWPVGDLALAVSVRRVKQLPTPPDAAQLEQIGESYRPWRSVAARLFWHHYLSAPRD